MLLKSDSFKLTSEKMNEKNELGDLLCMFL